MEFAIQPVATTLQSELQGCIDDKAKPVGSLGVLERLALRIGLIQNTLTPQLSKPTIVLFAGDHGVSAEGISPQSAAATAQTMLNILAGGDAINVFARENGLDLVLVDVGVDYDFPGDGPLIRAKVARGTNNYVAEPAMTRAQCEQAVASGAEVIEQLHRLGCNVVGLGELGIANSASAALLMALLCKLPLERCLPAEAGLDDAAMYHNVKVLSRARDRVPGHQLRRNPLGLLAELGGFEIAAIYGAMLRAAELGMIILVDGFVSGSALLAARAAHPQVLDYCIAAHRSDDAAHALMLQQLHGRALLNLRLRLGQGTGAALAFPLLRAAVAFLNDMANRDSTGPDRQPQF